MARAASTVRATLLLLALVTTVTPSARAAEAAAIVQTDLRRGVAAVGHMTSDEPAARLERQAREPSTAFLLGASLAAWTNAAATLAYDLKTPTGDGGDAEAIEQDCYDEKVAIAHLEARSRALDLTPQQVLSGAGSSDPTVLAAWTARRSGAPPACR